MVGVYEIRVESFDNGLTELERGTGQAPRKLVSQLGRNNNLNAGSKSDKIAKDTNKCTEVTQ